MARTAAVGAWRVWGVVGAVVVGGVLACGGDARGQIAPERTYYGINRAIPMTVAVPAGAEGPIEIRLLSAEGAETVHSAGAAAGAVDLAALFPTLWTTGEPRVLYAQLVVGEKKVGPAVVLQPLVSPAYAPRLDARGDPMFPAESRKLLSGIRAYVDKQVVMETSKGEVTVRLRPDAAPNTAWNFRHLVEGGFYTDIMIHRIVGDGAGFVIQFGDPTGTGAGGPGYYIDLEPSRLPHDFGVISMARSPDPNANGSQVFICLSRDQRVASLDGKYTTFAQVVAGAETITAIAGVAVGAQDRPVDPPMVRSARLVDAPPHGEGPGPVTKPEAGSPER